MRVVLGQVKVDEKNPMKYGYSELIKVLDLSAV